MRMYLISSVPSGRSFGDRRCRISKDKKCRSSCFWNGIFLNLLTHGSRLRFSSILLDCHSESNRHNQVGHYKWGSLTLTSVPWSHPAYPRTSVQSMEIILPSRSSSSTQSVSILNLQTLSSYFMFVSSWNHVVAYIAQSMISDFIFHGHLHGTCRGKAPPSANADRSVA